MKSCESTEGHKGSFEESVIQQPQQPKQQQQQQQPQEGENSFLIEPEVLSL